ncbi:MAG TPA: amidohydrolase family protein, partial [Vicinamibacterales bacterium]|nr:amidohydrolase family protein [Vicinamibacterales bacterium]
TGKFVLPGLWESQTAYSWYFGEAMLNHGITSSIDVGTEAEVAVPHRDAVLHGKDLAPRAFTGILRIGSTLNGATGYEGPLHTIRVPKSADDTREVVRTVLNAGADYVIFYDGAMPFDWYKAGVEEAHKMGKPAFVRAYGPGISPAQAAEIGAAQLPHSAGIPLAIAKTPSQFRQGRDDRNELDKYADMDDAKAADLIKALVAHHVSLVPTFFINYRGYPNDWAEFRAEAHEWYKDANLQKYYPKEPMEASLAAYDDVDAGALRERRLKGWENVKRFHKMFVDAGGRLVVSGNLNDRYVPGLQLFQEMRVMREVGMTPMQIIVGSTRYAAELVQKQDTLGTIEPGKTADVLIVSEDPLRDVGNLIKTDTVVFDGKVIDRRYHADYATTFNPPGDGASAGPIVEALPWVVALMKARPGGGPAQEGASAAGAPDPARSPQPAIHTIAPFLVTQGTTPVTITLKGINFVRRSVVQFKGKPVPTKVASPTELEFTLDADAMKTAGRFDLVVINPAPVDTFFSRGMWGNGTSNTAHLVVNYRY